MSISREMPRYRSIKTVWALKILSIDFQTGAPGAVIIPAEAGYSEIHVSPEFVDKHKPQAGGYFVQYEDGYTSYSPAAAFEGGNVAELNWGMPRRQEPKYRINALGRLENRLTNKAIPDEEAIFVFRAKDTFALGALIAYRDALINSRADEAHIEVVVKRIADFRAFAVSFPERMRAPNSPLAIGD